MIRLKSKEYALLIFSKVEMPKCSHLLMVHKCRSPINQCDLGSLSKPNVYESEVKSGRPPGLGTLILKLALK
jgi:hypothetical protein